MISKEESKCNLCWTLLRSLTIRWVVSAQRMVKEHSKVQQRLHFDSYLDITQSFYKRHCDVSILQLYETSQKVYSVFSESHGDA